MKKLLIVLLALTVVGIFVVAEDAPAASLSVGAWGRYWFSPVATVAEPDPEGDPGDLRASTPFVTTGPDWGGKGRVGVSFNGNSENVGFSWNPGMSGANFTAVCDQAKIWVKINPMIKLQVGQVQGDTLRGKFGDFGDMLPVSGEDVIFARFFPKAGLLVDITPMEGLYIGVALDSNTPSFNWDISSDTSLSDLADKADDYADWGTDGIPYAEYLKAIQIGAGYTIPNIGLARVQYIGAGGPMAATLSADDLAQFVTGVTLPAGTVVAATGYIQAAFAYTGMEGLLVDVGFRMPTDPDFQMLMAAAARYSKDALSATVRGDASFGGDSDMYVVNYTAAAQVVYSLEAPLAVGAEIAFAGMSKYDIDDSDARTVDIYPFAKLGYSNGKLQVGFDAKMGLDDQPLTYQIPILFEYSF
jgi:hypothetical protein